MDNNIRVLFLPRWYPHRQDPMPGLFIQRQAESLTSFCDVAVLYVQAEKDCPNKIEAEFAEENKVRVLRVYYQSSLSKSELLRKIFDFYRFYKVLFRSLKSISGFQPDLIHAHILTRMGWMAMRIAIKRNIPYLISEHWSRYFQENLKFRGMLKKLLTRITVKNAAAVLVVSEKLKQAMWSQGLKNGHYHIVPNIIDPQVFHVIPMEHDSIKKRMIHISCFEDRSKNISGFLNAVKSLWEERQDFECLLVGEGPDLQEMQEYASFLRLSEHCVRFTGLITGEPLVELINRADFLVLSSHFETFGSVVVESLSCGTPVLATPVGIVPEIIHGGNGMIAASSKVEDLTPCLHHMLNECRKYDRQQIRDGIAERFSPVTVGKLLQGIYMEILH